MIERIVNISEFGIFKEYNCPSELNSFTRYNLIYGWNGSGKSTLSKLFYCLSEKKLPTEYNTSSFEIKTNDDTINSSALNNAEIIKVFNEDFIKDNIDWDNLVKSLLYVSKGKVEDKKNLEIAVNNYSELIEQLDTLSDEINTNKYENENFLTDTGKEIKTQFEVLKTDDNTYLNYNKRNLRKLIQNHEALKHKKDIINENDVDYLKKIARLEFLESIDLPDILPIEYIKFFELQKKINKLLKTNIVSTSISGLKNDIELNNWVEHGLRIHKNLKKCKFCENEISDERKAKLNEHFNENYIKVKKELDQLLEETKNFLINEEITSYDSFNLYPFLKETWNKEIYKLKNCINEINNTIIRFDESIQKKLSNPFELGIKQASIKKSSINNYNKSLQKITEILKEHNNTTNTFYEKVKNAKESLELFYAHKELKKFKYFDRLSDIEKDEKKISELNLKLPPLENEIKRLEASLTDEVLGAEEFNTKLHRFLNHSDISLKFDRKNKGYVIIRKVGREEEKARNLSEGEKTAISFVFFLTKLKEDDEALKKSIVVIDDPISSFDSNHLFNAYSFIRNICNEVEQLIILTHNFIFFRLVKDWMEKKNDIKKGMIKSSFFSIQANYNNGIRLASLFNADDTLMKYNSEYHYLFSKLYEYKNKKTLSLEECFLISNITRKVLEIFLKFKFPKKRNDFYALLNEALKDKRYEVSKERIYKFINKYSHGDSIESFDDTIDNIISESKNIVDDVLKIIRKLDQNHYDELVEIM